jgi:hypothetical protein
LGRTQRLHRRRANFGARHGFRDVGWSKASRRRPQWRIGRAQSGHKIGVCRSRSAGPVGEHRHRPVDGLAAFPPSELRPFVYSAVSCRGRSRFLPEGPRMRIHSLQRRVIQTQSSRQPRKTMALSPENRNFESIPLQRESGTNRALGVQQGLERSVPNFLSIVRDEAVGDGSKNEEIDRDRGRGFEQSARCTR